MLDKDGLSAEISVGVTFSSLMGAVSLFFTGVLISQYQSFDSTIKVPLLFLIISTFSFIFSATIYSNASTEITLNKLKVVEKYMVYAKNIVEFLGLYPLILSMPLVIGAVTKDGFLRMTTTVVALVGMALYSQSKFSTLEKQLPTNYKRLFSVLFVAMAITLYSMQSLSHQGTVLSYTNIGVLVLVTLLIPAIYFSLKSKQYKMTFVRDYKELDASALSQMMKRNLNKLKSKYPGMETDWIEASSSEAAIKALDKTHKVKVAVFGGKAAGMISFDGDVITSVFTDLSLHRKGIGRMLVDAAEVEVGNNGFDHIDAHTGSTDVNFYKKLGFEYVGKNEHEKTILRKVF